MLCAEPPTYGPKPDPLAPLIDSWQLWVSTWSRDWGREIAVMWRTVTFIARYAGQDIDTVASWPLSKVVRVARYTGEYLDAENKGGAVPGLNYTGGAGR